MMAIVFAATIFISSFLLFLIQPLFTKMILPIFGGSPNVWNGLMFLFQTFLLIGYYYVHVLTRHFIPKKQFMIHLFFLVLVLFFLPFSVNTQSWRIPVGVLPVFWLSFLFIVKIGFIFFALSASAPLLQKWFSFLPGKSGDDPYFLYALSNAGSLAALLAYPFFIERNWPISGQQGIWCYGYFIFLVFISLSMFFAGRRGSICSKQDSSTKVGDVSIAPLKTKLYWFILSFVPCSFLYGVTSFISTDVAAIALFWVVPLAIYLITYILGFLDKRGLYLRYARGLFPFTIFLTAVAFALNLKLSLIFSVSVHLIGFFVVSLYCHSLLSAHRPHASNLTLFYFIISLGGVVAGLFNVFIAPAIFSGSHEYPITMIAACGVWSGWELVKGVARRWLCCVFPFLFMLYVFVVEFKDKGVIVASLFALVIIVVYFSSKRSRTLLGGAFFVMLFIVPFDLTGVVYARRNFFGINRIRVDKGNELKLFINGTTIHGAQSFDPALGAQPTTYYHPTGPLKDIFDQFYLASSGGRVAVVGLGVGSSAYYARAFDRFEYFEIDPDVVRIALDARYFTFLRDSRAPFRIHVGDGRLLMEKESDASYNMIILDVFSSDAIPVHMMTKEAIELYFSKLKTGGILAVHISNNHFDLKPVFEAVSRVLGLHICVREDVVDESSSQTKHSGKRSSVWLVLSRDKDDIEKLKEGFLWKAPGHSNVRRILWTDNYSNVFSVFKH